MTNLAPIGSDLLDAAKSLHDDTIELRRTLHAEPEIGLQLPVTQAKIVESLTGLGLDITLGESTSGVVADLDTGRPWPDGLAAWRHGCLAVAGGLCLRFPVAP